MFTLTQYTELTMSTYKTNTPSTRSVINSYPELVRKVRAGMIDDARDLLMQITQGHKPLIKDIEDAILRDTGRTIT